MAAPPGVPGFPGFPVCPVRASSAGALPVRPVCPPLSVLFAPARPAPSRLPVLSCLPCLSCSRQLGWRASVRKILTTENLEFNISKTGFRPSEARFFMLSRPENTVPHAKTVYLALQNSLSRPPKQSISHAKIVNLTRQNSQSYAPKQPVFRSPFLYTSHSQRLTQNAKYSA